MDTTLPIVLFLLIGILLGNLSRWQQRHPLSAKWLMGIPETLAESLTGFVIFVSLPALILLRIPSLQVTSDLFIPVLVPWFMIAMSASLVVAAGRLFHWSNEVRSLLLLLVPLGNTSFLGIPMVESFFGAEMVPYALLYDQLGSFLALATYGAVVIALHQNNVGGNTFASTVLRRVFAFPPFLALIVAIAFLPTHLPNVIRSALELLGNTLVPLVMIAVGSCLRFTITAKHRAPLAFGLGVKLVVAPLIALAGCRMLGLTGNAVDIAIFESGMPPMIAGWAVAMKAGLEPELGAALVSIGILLSFATLGVLFQLL